MPCWTVTEDGDAEMVKFDPGGHGKRDGDVLLDAAAIAGHGDRIASGWRVDADRNVHRGDTITGRGNRLGAKACHGAGGQA